MGIGPAAVLLPTPGPEERPGRRAYISVPWPRVLFDWQRTIEYVLIFSEGIGAREVRLDRQPGVVGESPVLHGHLVGPRIVEQFVLGVVCVHQRAVFSRDEGLGASGKEVDRGIQKTMARRL